jgi:DNA invertase Pin-like site-specific DNA recombinase
MMYGYARASTDGQSVEAQVRQLSRAGCTKVIREVASGAKTDRAQLRRLLGQLAAGDVLMVRRLDRLARSTRDLPTPSSRSPNARPDSARWPTHGPTRRPRMAV